MSVRGLGYWRAGLWTTGYWTDSYFPQKHITIPTGSTSAPTSTSRTSKVIMAIDDGGGASGIISVSIGTDATPDTAPPEDVDQTGVGLSDIQ